MSASTQNGRRGVDNRLTSPANLGSPSGVAQHPPTDQVGGHTLPLPAEWLDHLADLVADRLAGRVSEHSSPWLDRKAAAEYLGVPHSRVEKDRTIPSHRWEGRVLYHRDELDGWLLAMGPTK